MIFRPGLRHLVKGIDRLTGGLQHRAVHQLMSRPMLPPEPIHIRLAAQHDGQPGVGTAEALRTQSGKGIGGSVPAGGGLGHPEGAILEGAHIVKPPGDLFKLLLSCIVIELHHIGKSSDRRMVDPRHGHHIGSDRRLGIPMQNIRLHPDKIHVGQAVEPQPLQLQMRVVPYIAGHRRHLVKAVIGLAPSGQPPPPVQLLNGAVSLPQIPGEFCTADSAEAAVPVEIDLIVDLPAQHLRILAEFFPQLLRNAGGIKPVGLVVGAGVAAAAVLHSAAAVVPAHHRGIHLLQPDRRRGGGGTQNYPDPRLRQPVHHPPQPGEPEIALLRLHLTPGKFPDTHRRDTGLFHIFHIGELLLLIPAFRIVRSSQLGKLGIFECRFFLHFCISSLQN